MMGKCDECGRKRECTFGYEDGLVLLFCDECFEKKRGEKIDE